MARKKEAAHGGAWKVAYADFVTAMMALFMVLWISAQDQKIVIATSQYFRNPFLAAAADATSGVLPFNSTRSSPSTADEQGKEPGTQKERDTERQIKLTLLNSVAADFNRLLHLDEDPQSKLIDIGISPDGLKVTLFDRARKPLFVGDTAQLTDWGRFVMQNLAWIIDRHRFRVIIDGFTRSHLQLTQKGFTSWDLSADRALAARRALVHYAVDRGQIDRVSGYGDSRPLAGVPPDSESNQRLTISLSLSTQPLRPAATVGAVPSAPAPGPQPSS